MNLQFVFGSHGILQILWNDTVIAERTNGIWRILDERFEIESSEWYNLHREIGDAVQFAERLNASLVLQLCR